MSKIMPLLIFAGKVILVLAVYKLLVQPMFASNTTATTYLPQV